MYIGCLVLCSYNGGEGEKLVCMYVYINLYINGVYIVYDGSNKNNRYKNNNSNSNNSNSMYIGCVVVCVCELCIGYRYT